MDPDAEPHAAPWEMGRGELVTLRLLSETTHAAYANEQTQESGTRHEASSVELEGFSSDEAETVHTRSAADLVYLSTSSFFFGFLMAYPDTFLTYLLVANFEPAGMQMVWCALYAPWMAKVLYALLIDSLRMEAVTYIHCLLPVTTVLWLCIGLTNEAWVTILLYSGVSMCTAFTDVALDTIMVRRSKLARDPTVVLSRCYMWSSIGQVFGAYGGGWSFGHGGRGEVFSVCVFVTLIFWGVSYLLCNVEGSRRSAGDTALRLEFSWLRSKPLLRVLALTVAVHLVPEAYALFDYFQIKTLGFTPVVLGTLDMIGGLAVALGAVLYAKIGTKVPPFKLSACALAAVGIEAATLPVALIVRWNLILGVDDGLWASMNAFFRGVSGKMLAMPISAAYLPLCPVGREATAYAAFTNASNLASLVSSMVGSGLSLLIGVNKADLRQLWLLFVLRGICFVCLAPVAFWALKGTAQAVSSHSFVNLGVDSMKDETEDKDEVAPAHQQS